MRSPRLRALVASSFLFVLGSSQLSAGEPTKTPWGTLSEAFPGEFHAQVDVVDPDGRYALPESMPPVVRAWSSDAFRHGTISFPTEFDERTGACVIVIPKTPGATTVGFTIETATATLQRPDGRILFPASSATIVGETAKLETTGSNVRVGFWTNPDDYVTWDYDATRWGKYRVLLTYSNASPDGGVAKLALGGETLEVPLPSTGGWYAYRTVPAGEIYLATSGKHELTVKAETLAGGALMNLKSVVLEPACEGARPAQAEDGSVTLDARDATVQGTNLRYEPKPEKNTLGYWTKASDSAYWIFDVTRPGTFDVEVLQGCGKGQGGSTVGVSVGQTDLAFEVVDTGHFQNFEPRVIGRVRIETAGERALFVQPRTIAAQAACDIRRIRLISVAEQE